MADHTTPDAETEQEARADEHAEHRADRQPTKDEEKAAERSRVDPEVADAYREAIETGAEVKGEGEI